MFLSFFGGVGKYILVQSSQNTIKVVAEERMKRISTFDLHRDLEMCACTLLSNAFELNTLFKKFKNTKCAEKRTAFVFGKCGVRLTQNGAITPDRNELD
ncbi:hypothetical protein Taro_048247 [Colocasia esculenta]|uniref:Uncharacterized protein n=1 Tax=Colocasia esculenta TaxID=4460 RepID=A0A843X2H7_COLES|nr:hypothetical protein [Colocasia esculenta]